MTRGLKKLKMAATLWSPLTVTARNRSVPVMNWTESASRRLYDNNESRKKEADRAERSGRRVMR